MARLSDTEIERIKSEVSLVRLIEGAGYALKPQGKDLAMRCPLHEGDETPSFVVTPAKNVWHCFGCERGGTVIDWVMATRKVSFRHAVELLRGENAALSAPVTQSVRTVTATFVPSADDAALLAQVIDYYHATLKGSTEARDYLASRGLTHPELVEHFKLGYGNRTLGYQMPESNRVQGAAMRGALQRLGLLRASGHEHFAGSLVIPVLDEAGAVTEVYGRKVGDRLRAGTALHLYLPGPHRGVFNLAGWRGSEEVILCESLIDALTFWCAGYRHVTSSFGVGGFTDEMLSALVAHGVERVLIAYDRDAAGDAAAAKLAPILEQHGIAPYRVQFPKGMDANEYALKVTPAVQSLGLVLRQAEYIGKNAAPAVRSAPVLSEPAESIQTPAVETSPLSAPTPDDLPLVAASALSVPAPEVATAEPPEPCSPVPKPAPAIAAEVREHDVLVTFGERRYRVRGLAKNLAFDVLRVNVLASSDRGMHVDTLDLYQAKARAVFVKQANVELGVEESVIQRDLGQVLLKLETLQDEAITKATAPMAGAAPALSEADHAAALELLRDPTLVERIVSDVAAIGVVGEDSNALVGYLACVSRKLDKPLAILIQSTSAAGKSTLMDALLSLMPESERVHYSAMTGQSLFYLGEQAMKHKILAIAEEEGVRQAAYALKLLQSQGELTIASTGKDPTTGQLVTQEYRVEGPVMLFLTTTAIDIDEELLNRCLVLTINESREQTAAIQTRQRAARTLDGLLSKVRSDHIVAAHRAAQTLLRPLAVVNPYAERLTFAHDRVRLRRDHAKYLALIDSIALLHQHQREVRRVEHGGKTVEYVEVTPADIALANRLAHEVLGRSLDELPPQTRRVLGALDAFVRERMATQALARSDVRLTRRDIRACCGLSEAGVRVHVDRLVELDYLLPHAGRHGQRFCYELLFDGDADADAPQVMGLFDVTGLGTTPTSQGSASTSQPDLADLAGRSQAVRTPFAGPSQAEETPYSASADAASSLVAALDLSKAPQVPRRAKLSYRNGSGIAASNSS